MKCLVFLLITLGLAMSLVPRGPQRDPQERDPVLPLVGMTPHERFSVLPPLHSAEAPWGGEGNDEDRTRKASAEERVLPQIGSDPQRRVPVPSSLGRDSQESHSILSPRESDTQERDPVLLEKKMSGKCPLCYSGGRK
ncbi:uncharacterized protein LOC144630416 isoform X2 [Oculina patagonica]